MYSATKKIRCLLSCMKYIIKITFLFFSSYSTNHSSTLNEKLKPTITFIFLYMVLIAWVSVKNIYSFVA